MVLPRWLATANRTITNKLLRRLPRRWSPFVIVYHVGRRSGRPYSAPLVAFRADAGFVFTPTYGPDADWVRNVLAAGSFQFDKRGEIHDVQNARLITRDEAWPYLPRPIRLAMRLLAVRWYVRADSVREEHRSRK